MLTGNLQGTFQELNVFIDSVAGGENPLTPATDSGGFNPANEGWADKYAGFMFDTGFEADYIIMRMAILAVIDSISITSSLAAVPEPLKLLPRCSAAR